jgi:hypothetical protein
MIDAIKAAEEALDDAAYWGGAPKQAAIWNLLHAAKRMQSQLDRQEELRGKFQPARLEIVVNHPLAKDQLERFCAAWHTWFPNSCYIDLETNAASQAAGEVETK